MTICRNSGALVFASQTLKNEKHSIADNAGASDYDQNRRIIGS